MATVVKRNKALSVQPLKSSQTIGAALAFLGFDRAIPMLHGSQGCTAFGKVFFVRHFREPIPLQSTAMDQISSVMGAQDNIIEGFKTICAKNRPALIGLPTTGLAETQGADVAMAVREFRTAHPEFEGTAIVPVATPDFNGCLETGFAAAVEEVIRTLVPERPTPKPLTRRINLLVSAHLTPGDVEELKVLCESFDLEPFALPDLADSLDGHLPANDFNPLTIGGTAVERIATMGEALATIAIGPSIHRAADLLHGRTGVPDYRLDHLYGLDATDALLMALREISGRPVPPRVERQRAQLQDAMLDCHFMLGLTRFALAGDPDQVNAFSHLIAEMGGETVAAVVASNGPAIERVATGSVKIGDLQDLEQIAAKGSAELLIGNSHCGASAERLGIPLLHAGFPLYDRVGAFTRTWIGYRGARQALFDLANLLLHLERGEIHPYHSIYAAPEEAKGNPLPIPHLEAEGEVVLREFNPSECDHGLGATTLGSPVRHPARH